MNGTPTGEHEAVGVLLARVGSGGTESEMICSGTLIGCRTFLTAQHCFCYEDGSGCPAGQPPAASSFRIFLQHAGFFEVSAIRLHPQYDFPSGDVALVELAEPVRGIRPLPLGVRALPTGSSATIVGFGETRGGDERLGVKRSGEVTVGSCGGVAPANKAICWTFRGEGANTCNGDSGGPLLADVGGGPEIFGVTSGGQQSSCLATDWSFDASVPAHRPWIVQAAGADLLDPPAACGDVAPVGSATARVQVHETFVAPLAGGGDASTSPEVLRRRIEVPAGTRELRVGIDAIDDGGSFLDLAVAPDSPDPGTGAPLAECENAGPGAFAFCRVVSPVPGLWTALVTGRARPGPLQMVAATLPPSAETQPPPVPATCGNGAVDNGESCDGAADAACPGACRSDCSCATATDPDGGCESGALDVRQLSATRSFSSFTLQALLSNHDGRLDHLDPTGEPLQLVLADAATAIELQIPAGDPGWAAPKRGRWSWRSPPSSIAVSAGPSLRGLSLTRFGGPGGPLLLSASGRVPPGPATPSRRNLRARLRIGPVCLR